MSTSSTSSPPVGSARSNYSESTDTSNLDNANELAPTRSFNYSSSCELEVHCSPFGITGLYIKVSDSESVGIGSTMARLTGFTTGTIYYNNGEDLTNAKYKLYGLIEEDDILRIDFIKIFLSKEDSKEEMENNSSPQSNSEEQKTLPSVDPSDEGYEPPDIVFRGKVPAGRPDVVEPFIGIFNFEKPTATN